MNFGSGGNTGAKAWRDIWGAGQGVGSIDRQSSVKEFVEQLADQYAAARDSLSALAH